MADQETMMMKDALLDHIHAGRSQWESTLAQLSAEQMTTSALFDSSHFAWMQGAPFAEWVSANTFEHYDEHLADLSAWLDR